VLGQLQGFAGDAQLEATSVGGYGTLIGPGGWYLDSILMTSFYWGDGKSTNGIGAPARGREVINAG
jgi:autotransporter family porin